MAFRDLPAAPRSKLTLACLLTLGALLCSSATALASRPHQFTASFGELCTSEPCEGASLQKPNGVAVNEATGDIYVVDEGEAGGAHGRVVRFDEEGAFLSEFNGSGELLNGKGETFEGKAAGSGGEPGEVETGRFEKPETVAVDNSCVLRKLSEPKLTQEVCEEEDPSNGDVYVVDAGHEVIDKYTPTGEYVGQITEGEGGRFESRLEGVAVDPKGRVWVYQEAPFISGFSNHTPNQFVTRTPKLELPGFSAPGLAVDAAGNFYARNLVLGHGRITKVSPSGEILTPEVEKEDSSAVAVDQSTDDALIDNLTSIAVLDSSGTLIERLGQENGEEHLEAGAGIGVNAHTSTIYVAQSAAGEVAIFGPQEPSAPKVESESVAEVTSTSASLAAQINPRSEPNEAPTTYRFQYGACPTLDPASCAGAGYEEVPKSAGQIPADFEVHPVNATVQGLKPSTTYHFRAVAENSHGEGQPGAEVTFTTQSAGGELILPDGRGYELVSPPDKQGAQIQPIWEGGGVSQAAASGAGITYLANAPTEAAPQGYTNTVQILSRREGAAWSSRDIALPHSSATGFAVGPGPEYRFFNPELSLSVVQPYGEFIPQLSEEASESTAFLHDLGPSCATHCFRPLVTGNPGFANVPEGTQFGEEELCKPKVTGAGGATNVVCGPRFLGTSEDLRHIVVRSSVALTDGGPAPGLYEWSAGALAPVSVLPGGEAAVGDVSLGLESQATQRAISSDGTRIAWSTTPAALYLRDMTHEETAQLDRAEETGGEPCEGCESGGGRYQIASADGSRVLFTDTNKLTSDSGANPGGKRADLYECKILLTPKLSCELSDLTPQNGEEAARVRGSVLGASEDGQTLYFVANGVQSGANGEGKSPTAGQPNLYVREGTSTSFIATLSGGDETDWSELKGTPASLFTQPTRVSANGRYLEFMSQAQPTGYDNRDLATGKAAAEVYLYDASAKKLRCASCMPSGERPVGIEYHKLEPGSGGLVGGPRDIWPASALVAANVPGWTVLEKSPQKTRYQPRYLNNQGRLFFNTADALQSEDSNNTEDVYEYEPPGIKGPEGEALCGEAAESFSARSGGCVSLISSGKSAQESAFLDASESGDDVFFLTQARLSPQIDTDNALDVYDAHVCTHALPCITYASNESSECSGESSCKAPSTSLPQIFGAPASQTFTGPGNLAPAPPPAPPHKTAEQIRIEKLNKALKLCRAKHNKKKRAACERSARKRYAKPGSKAKKKAKAKRHAKGAHK
jgi:DNA-binding beta-propeller fold protein YncE